LCARKAFSRCAVGIQECFERTKFRLKVEEEDTTGMDAKPERTDEYEVERCTTEGACTMPSIC
jgi:hypothetical protein